MNIEKCLNTYNTKTIDGKKCSHGSRIGYCWCKLHRGYLVVSLLKEHKCIENNCVYFQKFEDAPYWRQKEKEKKTRKEKQKERKTIEQCEKNLTIMAREMVNENNDICVINVHRNEKEDTYTIRYVSTNNERDIAELQNKLSEQSNKKCQWVSIKATPETRNALIQKYSKTTSFII
jgi:hypothetical protein